MINLQQFLPRMNHVLCGRPPKTSLAQMEAKLRSYRESSLSELMHIFGAWIPFSRLQPKGEKVNSRRRDYSLAMTFWAFLWQVLTPCTPCLEVVRKVQSFCSELKLKILALVTSPTARRAGDWPAKISMRCVSAFWNVFWRECVKSNSGFCKVQGGRWNRY